MIPIPANLPVHKWDATLKIIHLALTTKYVLKREKLMLFFVKQLYLEYLKFDFE